MTETKKISGENISGYSMKDLMALKDDKLKEFLDKASKLENLFKSKVKSKVLKLE